MSDTTVLPDGSAFFTGSLPLPKDHWLYAPRCAEWDSVRDTTADTPHPILNNSHRQAVIAAIRYAVRGATMCGQDMDFDPDALALNAAYALCGPATGQVLPADATQPDPKRPAMSDDTINKLRKIALACCDHNTTDALDKIIAKADRAAPAQPRAPSVPATGARSGV